MAQMRVEKTTHDFADLVVARSRGYYRKHYFCPNCGIELGCETFDRKRMFGRGSILVNGEFPKYCPECGAKVEKE